VRQSDYEELIARFTRERQGMGDEKSKEYARETDRHYNFKTLAALLGPLRCPHCGQDVPVPPEFILMVYKLKHVFSLLTFVRSGCSAEGTEPIEGRIADDANYDDLLLGLVAERKGGGTCGSC
jgi:hypothetical protein